MNSETKHLVEQEQRAKFEQDGYLVFEPPGLPESLVDGIVTDLDARHKRRVVRGGITQLRGRISDAWRFSENVKALALWPGILTFLQEFYGRKPLPFQTLNFPTGTEQAAHSDTIHFDSKPPGYMCGVWVALEDIDMGNGPLIYYPGSHKLPQYSMKDAALPPGPEHSLEYESFIADVIEREQLKPAYGTIRKGQAFIWAANLLHGGAAQEDKNRTRHSQVTHYYFDGCRYWTPLLSDESHIHWRNPEWIS